MVSKLVTDGINLIENRAFQSFIPPRVGIQGKMSVTIPPQILKHLNMKAGDILEVAIRKISPEYASANYNFRVVDCPKCGLTGVLHQWGTTLTIAHSPCDGIKGRCASHFITRWEFPTFYEKYRQKRRYAPEKKRDE